MPRFAGTWAPMPECHTSLVGESQPEIVLQSPTIRAIWRHSKRRFLSNRTVCSILGHKLRVSVPVRTVRRCRCGQKWSPLSSLDRDAVWSALPEEVRAKGARLDDQNVAEDAYPVGVADEVVTVLRAASAVILGGDFWVREADGFTPTNFELVLQRWRVP